MLIRIGPRQDASTAEDPVALLRGCHERIRRFGAMAQRLAEPAPADDRAAAALAVRRYFCEALPLHVADEDESLAPRLVAAGDGAVRAAVERMAAEHGPIEEAIAAAAPLWAALAAAPADPALLAAVAATGAHLSALLLPHIEAEEAELFPAVAALDAAAQAAILAELRARRG